MTTRVLVAALVLAGCQAAAPPVVEDTPAPPAPVAPPQLLADVAALADDALLGRASGTTGGALAARYIEDRFRAIGVEPALADGYRQPFRLPTGGEGVNLIGTIPGTVFPQQAILVTAHYDGLGVRGGEVYNGADDNASGVAALLLLAERLRERSPEHTILVAALDAEEIGLIGAQALASEPPVPLGAILVTVNLDMVSRGELWAAGTTHYPHLRPILAEAGLERFGHDTGAGAENWTGASDHAAFHRRGVPFVYLGVEDHADYHRPTDDSERIDSATFARAAAMIVRVVEALDDGHAALVAGR